MFIEVKKTTFPGRVRAHAARLEKNGRLVLLRNMSEAVGAAAGMPCGLLVGIDDQAGKLAINIGTGGWKLARNGSGLAIAAPDLKRHFAEGTRFMLEEKDGDMIVLRAANGEADQVHM